MLLKFQNCGCVAHNGPIRLPLFAPYHAPHLICKDQLCSLLDNKPDMQCSSESTESNPLLDAVTGPSRCIELRSSFLDALEDIFSRPLHLDSVFDALASIILSSKTKHARLISISTLSASELHTALNIRMGTTIEILPVLLQQSGCINAESTTQPRRAGRVPSPLQSKIAIVGMSGRFPGARSTDELWKILYNGLDVHSVAPTSRWDVQTHVDPSGKK